MKAAWIAPFILALAATPALAVDTDNNVQQQSQTQGNVSPNAINPGQGKQPDGYNDGGENQQHPDDFGGSKVSNAEGDTSLGNDQDTDSAAGGDEPQGGDSGASDDSGGSIDSGGSAESHTDSDD